MIPISNDDNDIYSYFYEGVFTNEYGTKASLIFALSLKLTVTISIRAGTIGNPYIIDTAN